MSIESIDDLAKLSNIDPLYYDTILSLPDDVYAKVIGDPDILVRFINTTKEYYVNLTGDSEGAEDFIKASMMQNLQ